MKIKITLSRRTWLLFSTALLAALAVLSMVNAANASLPGGPISAASQSTSVQLRDDPFVANFNCADIARYHIDKQANVRADAIMAKCGSSTGGGAKDEEPALSAAKGRRSSAATGIAAFQQLLQPLNYGG